MAGTLLVSNGRKLIIDFVNSKDWLIELVVDGRRVVVGPLAAIHAGEVLIDLGRRALVQLEKKKIAPPKRILESVAAELAGKKRKKKH